MAQSPIQDFIVNSGLQILGTATVISPTGNTSTLQVNGGAAIAKNLIVGGDVIIYGNITGTFTNLTVTGLSTLNSVIAVVTTSSYIDVSSRLTVG